VSCLTVYRPFASQTLVKCLPEIDPVRRRKAIDEIWHEDGVFYDRTAALIAAATKSTHRRQGQGYSSRLSISADLCAREIGDAGGSVGCPARQASRPICGTDFLVARDAKSRRLYVFRRDSLARCGVCGNRSVARARRDSAVQLCPLPFGLALNAFSAGRTKVIRGGHLPRHMLDDITLYW